MTVWTVSYQAAKGAAWTPTVLLGRCSDEVWRMWSQLTNRSSYYAIAAHTTGAPL